MRTLILAVVLVVLRATSAYALACQPENTKTRYIVCVVDEAGRPVKGAVVHAVRELMHEGFGDVGFSNEDLGTQTTNASGAAVFSVPKIQQSWLASSKDFRRHATADVNGWPVQGTGPDDRIVVGPLRTVLVRTKDRQCDGTSSVMIYGPDGGHSPDAKQLREGAYTVELGPGAYLVQHRLCSDGHDASTQIEVLGKDLGKTLDL